MQKNDIVRVEITDIGTSGEGIGKVDGYTLFIKDAVIGDVVEAKIMKAKKNFGYARLMNIISPSEMRIGARCPEAKRCGGCQIHGSEKLEDSLPPYSAQLSALADCFVYFEYSFGDFV